MFSPTAQRLFKSSNPAVQQALKPKGAGVQYTGAVNSPQGATYQVAPQGQVLGVQAPSAGGSLRQQMEQGKIPWDDNLLNSSGVLEQAPQAPNFEQQNGGLYSEALSAIDQQISARNASFDTEVSGIESTAASRKADVGGQLEEVKQNTTGQETREIGRTEESVNELRRQSSEMNQGIQARYGGTTGTGAFASELVGREALSQMSSNRKNLQNVLGDIFKVRSNAISEHNKQVFQIDSQTEQLTKEAQVQLQTDIAQFKQNKGLLLADRQKQIVGALQNYQTLISDVNARNTAFKQKLYQDQKDFDQQLATRKFNAVFNYATYLEKNLPNLLSNRTITPQGISNVEQTIGAPTGTFQTAPFPPSKTKEEDDLY